MSTMDLRQALAGVLTLSMFIMLGNMVKKDHFDSVDVEIPETSSSVSQYGTVAVTGQSLATVSHLIKGTSKENEGLRPCWNPTALKESEQSNGFITFSLTNGPEYHLSQVADAVMVARYLGATLVLPDIKGSNQGYRIMGNPGYMFAQYNIIQSNDFPRLPLQILNFGEVYDVQKFLDSLNGLIKVTRTQPPQASNGNLPVVKVPNMVSENYIVTKIKPIYESKRAIKIESYFPSMNSTMAEKKSLDPLACQAMFGRTLQLQSEIEEVAESMVQKLRSWSQNSNGGQIIAVDLRSEVLKNKGCDESDDTGRKRCYQAKEVGEFLKKVGFSQETAVYVTQPRWHPDLDELRDIFPKTYTKESVIPSSKRGKFLSSESSEFEKVIDFYICSKSDVFVPSIPGPLYANVAAIRIASGKNQILVPDEIANTPSASASDFISPFVSHKTHFAYSCFC